MNDDDRSLIEQLAPTNEELTTLVQAHRVFEDQLDEMSRRRYLTGAERLEMARIKKQKLRGKDRILGILADWRRTNS